MSIAWLGRARQLSHSSAATIGVATVCAWLELLRQQGLTHRRPPLALPRSQLARHSLETSSVASSAAFQLSAAGPSMRVVRGALPCVLQLSTLEQAAGSQDTLQVGALVQRHRYGMQPCIAAPHRNSTDYSQDSWWMHACCCVLPCTQGADRNQHGPANVHAGARHQPMAGCLLRGLHCACAGRLPAWPPGAQGPQGSCSMCVQRSKQWSKQLAALHSTDSM